MLGDPQLDATLPLPGLGPLLGRPSDERRRRMLLLQVLEDRDRLADHAAVVELEGRYLPAGVLVGVGRATILGASEVDVGLGELELLLVQEHAERAGVRSERVVYPHPGPPTSARGRAQWGCRTMRGLIRACIGH